MKILFVGNSATQYNPGGIAANSVVEQFKTLAGLGGQTVTTKMSYIGGGTLEDHWNDSMGTIARNEIATGTYDLVVMNGADEPNFTTYANMFADLAQANGAQVMLYGLWAGDWQISATSDSYTAAHNSLYRSVAVSNDAAYAPNARAFAAAHAALTQRYGDDGTTAENMLTADTVHPSALMAYMIANVLYRTTFGEAPPSAATWRPAGIALADAQLMQTVATNAVKTYGIVLDGGGRGGDPMTAVISGRLFDDADDNGVDNAEPGVAGETVSLIQNGAVVATATTSANGGYSFTGLAGGTYQVQFDAPNAGYEFVAANIGSNDGIDSDVTTILGTGAGRTASIVLGQGATNATIDAGVRETGGTPPGDEPPILVFNPASYALVRSGTANAETVSGSSGNDYLTALAGNDRINANVGNDYLDGGAGADSTYGGAGADVFLFDAADAVLNAGTQVDRILFRTAGAQDARGVALGSVEIFDLANGLTDNITFGYQQMRKATDAELRIVAETGDTVRIAESQAVTLLGSVIEDGQTYLRYRVGLATFGIDEDANLYVGGVLV